MHKRMQKQIEQMPHILTKKCPKKLMSFFNIYIYLFAPLPLKEFRVGMDMGKKRWLLKKKLEKREKESCFVPHTLFFHMVGGSRTSKTTTSSSSSNSNNSSNIY